MKVLIGTLGGKVLAYYLDGIAVYNHGKISSYMENSEATRASAFYMVDQPEPEYVDLFCRKRE